jgi:immune inhibitor A
MTRWIAGSLWLALAVGLSLDATPQASPAGGSGGPGRNGHAIGHAKPLPGFVAKREKERRIAADLVAKGQATVDENGLVTLKDGRPVRYRLEGVEYLTAVLVDFTDVQHNQIPQPNRAVDNSTYWTADFTPGLYRDMLFTPGGGSYGLPSMRDFYLEQSSGRFAWNGQVSSWVQINAPQSEFGANARRSGPGGDDLNGPVYRVVAYTLQALAASGNYGGLDLAAADQVDRYDCDGDGVYAEPDGYVDHFGIVKAGVAEDGGGGAQGGDAIWSHRWYANFNQSTGPEGCALGGYNLPGTDLWVGDYTIQGENGGLGVFAHEFGHDLGLPDLYDTAGATDNSTAFWSLMSSGSWASDTPNALGVKPVHMGAWEKLALGWLDETLARVALGSDVTLDLGPAETATRNRAQALRVDLPDYTTTSSVFPVDGADPNYYYSTKGDGIDTSMSKPLALAGSTSISFRANWDIEADWDYAYLEAQIGGVWQPVPTSASRTTNPNGQNFGYGISGASGGWVTVTATLPAGMSAYRFRYWTDEAVVNPGIAIDSISVIGFTDNSTNPSGWALNGFRQLTAGQFTETYFHYYLVESRSYIGNDRSLCGAYNFLAPDWVERQCYADGLLVWYRNSAFGDNNTSQHPGAGQILPVDAHPAASYRPDGRSLWNSRWQAWDATFGVDANQITLSQVGNGNKLLSKAYAAPAVPRFFDSSTTAYYDPTIPWSSVKTAGSGLKIDIVGVSPDRGSYRVRVYR